MTIYEINDNLSDFLFWIQEKYSCFNKDEFPTKILQNKRLINDLYEMYKIYLDEIWEKKKKK